MKSAADVTVVGAGLAGTLMSILLAKRGLRVDLYERHPDQRRTAIPAGRSINLALAARGMRALQRAGVMEAAQPLLIPMPGRMLHDLQGQLTFVPYGQREHEVIYSVSRPGLNRVLLDAAQRAGVTIHFESTALGADFERSLLLMRDERTGQPFELPLTRVIGADGAGSPLRHALVAQRAVPCTQDMLPHGYKELTLPAGRNAAHQIETHALHIWPRGGFMLIALPDLGGTFTVTLFLPLEGPESFASLRTEAEIAAFFARYFPDVGTLIPDLTQQFLARPIGSMGTVRCERWCEADRLLLIGDAAHAVTPFHGQGMNCAFEDCAQLDALLDAQTDWQAAFSMFSQQRLPQANAIADMALENYVEMRDTVRDPKFQLQKALSLELERRHPERFVPRYSMVMFHHDIPYATAFERGRVQQGILDELTRDTERLEDIDYAHAAALILDQLPPLS